MRRGECKFLFLQDYTILLFSNMLITKWLVTFCLICWSLITVTARADDVEFLPSLEPTRTVSKLPAEVRRLTPRAAQTLELKIFRIGDKHSDILLHLYTDSEKNSSTAYLDLYLWHVKRFIRIHSFPVRQPNGCPPSITLKTTGDFEIYQMQWLDLKKKAQPVIAIRAEDCTDHSEAKIRFFIFSDGIRKPPKQQSFDYYFNSWASQTTQFASVKGQDKVCISQYYSRTQGGPDSIEERHTLYEWTGKQFTLIPFPTNHSQ